MQKQKLRTSQQLQQVHTMSISGQHEELPNSQNYLNNPSENSNMPFRLQLTPQQAAYLASRLPTHYSFQLETKPIKRATSTTKNIKEPLKASTEVHKKTSKEEAKNSGRKGNSAGSQKGNSKYSQEIENAVYQKYSNQKDYRKTSFEHISEAIKPCVRILNLLKNSRTSWPFREPVDPIALGIPHYTEIISEPMDLSTVENNLRTNQYVTPTQFHADVSKIITNSYTFNSSNIQFTRITAQFQNYYRKITAEPGSEYTRGYSHSDMGGDGHYSKVTALEAKKSKKEHKETDYSHSSVPVISMAEKKELGANIKKLPKEDMKGILDIIKEGTGKITGEFDLKELDPMIIRKLQVYVKEKLSAEGRAKTGMMGRDNMNNENEEESSFEVSEGDQSK